MNAVVIVAFVVLVLGVPVVTGIALGRRQDDARIAAALQDITPPGRLIDRGTVMDPDRLRRAVD